MSNDSYSIVSAGLGTDAQTERPYKSLLVRSVDFKTNYYPLTTNPPTIMSKQLRIWLFVLLGTLLASSSLLAEGAITMTTSQKVGETIALGIRANGDLTIDGVKESAPTNENNYYTLTSQTITIRGDVTSLACDYNQLTSLDVSGCTALTFLSCRFNQLTSLDLSGCTSLKTLYCGSNQLTSLNVAGCTALTMLNCRGNDSLAKLNASGCSNLTTLLYYTSGLSEVNLSGCKLLKSFSCVNGSLTSLDVSGCTALTTLECDRNRLTSLDVSDCSALTTLNCWENQLTSLDLSGCTALTTLYCGDNRLTSLDVLQNVALTKLDCSNNQLTSLDVSQNVALTELSCEKSQLTSLDVSKNVALTELSCGWNRLTSLNVSGYSALTTLQCYENQLTSLDVSGCSALTTLECFSNQLTSLDVSGCSALTDLNCTSNLLRELNISGCNNLNSLECYGNQIKGTEMANLVNSLPDRQGKEVGSFRVLDEGRNTGYEDGNVCLAAHVAIAKAKNWRTLFYRNREWLDYAGLDNPTFTVTYSSSRGGSIIITGADDLRNVPYDTELTVTETNVADGYKLTRLTANGQDILKTKRFKVTAKTRVEATFTLQAYSVTTIKLGEGTLYVSGADDLEAVTPGTELTVTAIPAEGYELTELTANDKNILDTKKVVVNEDLIIKAIFSQKTFKVSLTKRGNGTIRAIGADDLNAVPYGTELTIEATPATGSTLTALVAGGINIIETKKVTIKKETTIEAVFTTQSFAVKLTKEGEGTISATGADDLAAVDYGTELTIEATPATGYELTALTANGTDILASKKVIVKDNLTVKATFTQKARTYTVTFTQTGEGTVTATGADDLNAVPYGAELTISATPETGYELTALTANGEDILATKSFVVKGATEIRATFSMVHFAVTLTQDGEGKVDATGAKDLTAVPYGTELTIVATPKQGYELTALTANDKDILATRKVVVTEDLTVKATFAKETFVVTLDKEGEGVLDATGADNLKAVPYGTKLTITATPAEGYELKALLADGFDIRSTKSVEVTGDTRIKAIFTQQTFAVTLTSNEHGKITIAEPVDLKVVPYGTKLTVKATGKNAQCVLTALTANGEDILATQSFVVKGATEVKAAFVDHTGVETTVTQQVRLYPNPATDYVIVEGVAPASEVTLHSMTGERLYAGRADSRGTLRIDLTPYADGVYLVCVAGETYRVVVRH